MDRRSAADALQRMAANIETVIVGKRRVVEVAVLAVAAGGHILVEDAPGLGKTMLARSIARSIDGSFKRVQATPDLLPSDITGVSIYQQRSGEFEFHPGPVFANVVVVDEVNRTTPRTQAALLEAMEEHQVTVDGVTRHLPEPFLLIATQNPIEYHGTYPLPEGQLDRFLFATSVGYPAAEEERRVVTQQLVEHPVDRLSPVMSLSEVLGIQAECRATRVEPEVVDYAVALAAATREHPDLALGAGPRGTLGLVRAAQARALFVGREYVLPDDVKVVAPAVLGHRLVPKPQHRVAPGAGAAIVAQVLAKVPVPTAPAAAPSAGSQ
jgi:MoxR-like ATPase